MIGIDDTSFPVKMVFVFPVNVTFLKMFIRANILTMNKITRGFISMEN